MPRGKGSANQSKSPRGNQTPINGGRGRGQSVVFTDVSQGSFHEMSDSNEYLVLDFKNMGVLTEASNVPIQGGGAYRGGRGRANGNFASHRGRGQWQPRGRGRGSFFPTGRDLGMPSPGPAFRGRSSPSPAMTPAFRGRGGGLGFVTSPERLPPRNWDMKTRPLLRPIKFVRAAERLFEADPEELLQAHEIPPHPSDQLDPQTDRLAAVFDNEKAPPTAETTADPTAENSENDATEIKEAVVQAASSGALIGLCETNVSNPQSGEDLLAFLMGSTSRKESAKATEELFFVDTTRQTMTTEIIYKAEGPVLGEEEPDEVILIPSPSARKAASIAGSNGKASTVASPLITRSIVLESAQEETSTRIATSSTSLQNITLDFSKEVENKSLLSFSVARAGRAGKVPARARKEAKRRKRTEDAWTNDLGNVFGFKDGREGLRKGDSDLNVGSSSEEIEDHGMDVDGDLDATAMAAFAREMNKPHQSMDDVELEAAVERGEFDSDDEGVGAEDEEEDEDEDGMDPQMMLEEVLGLDDEEDWSSDDGEDDLSPEASFAARLLRVRERTPGTSKDIDQSWADRDEDYIAGIERILEENADILMSRDRKTRKALFRAIQNGESDYPFPSSSKSSKVAKDRADLLAEQWLRDRNKKAERKRQRELERQEQGGLGNGKTKGKSRNPDLEEIEQMMRDLITSVAPGAPKSFELPALDKPMRIKVHALAQALNLKSTSAGGKKNGVKTMTISRGNHTGVRWINEAKVDSVLKRKKGSRPGGPGLKGIREGEVIGHQAAKIAEDNIGYRMLAQMGWSEGDRIGVQGGLDAPITAVMKKTKLGLGAFRGAD